MNSPEALMCFSMLICSLWVCATCEKTSTLCPCSFSFLSIFCSSVSFPEALVSADPSYAPLGVFWASYTDKRVKQQYLSPLWVTQPEKKQALISNIDITIIMVLKGWISKAKKKLKLSHQMTTSSLNFYTEKDQITDKIIKTKSYIKICHQL